MLSSSSSSSSSTSLSSSSPCPSPSLCPSSSSFSPSSSFKNYLLNTQVHFKKWVICILLFCFLSSWYTLDINFLSNGNLRKISLIPWASSLSAMASLAVQMFLSCPWQLLALFLGQIESYSESPFIYLHIMYGTACFLLAVLGFTFQSSNHLDLVSVRSDRFWLCSLFCIRTSNSPNTVCWGCFLFSSACFGISVKY